MKPYTDTYQKTMIPVHGKPLLEYIIEGIKSAEISDIILVVGYRKEQIINHFQDGNKWGLNIEYIEQKELNGTGGAVLTSKDAIEEEHFLCVWGDILVNYKTYQDVVKLYEEENLDFILVTNYVDDPYKGGAIYCNGNYCIDYVEKPPIGKAGSNLNNCGIFVFSREIFDVLELIEPSKRGEIEIPDAICHGINKRNWKVRVYKISEDQFRGDFGDVDEYERLKDDPGWIKKLKI